MHLIKRLRQHEALQRRCGPGTEAYRATAAQLRSWRRNGTKDGVCRYLVLVSYRGLGNRILAAASAFLYERLGIQVRLAPFLPLTFEVKAPASRVPGRPTARRPR